MILLPMPRRLEMTEGFLLLPRRGYIQLLDIAADLLPAARVMQRGLAQIAGIHYEIVASGLDEGVVIDLLISSQLPHQQGYEMEIEPAGIHITAASPEGAFYAAQTLVQILRQHADGPIPSLQIEDRPDFRARGVMLDISRDKVPTMATLFALADQLAELKINQLQLYTEHTFAYRGHPTVWAQASPMTGEEILELDQYCRDRFIELVPNQNSFGHMERWLKLPAYRDLAEAPDGFTFPWGVRHAGGFTLNPLDPRSIELVVELYDELLPHFTSPLFNVGCDETFDLGLGQSKAECDRVGKGRVYLDYLKKIHALLQDHQRIMMFWGDIIIHHPALIPELPRDVVALEWGYEAGHPFDEHLAQFDSAGIPVFVCPGTSSWCSITGRTDNALANLREAAAAGIKNNAAGYLITDWGDYGHHQPLSISYLPYAAGAAYSWAHEANRRLDLPAALDAHVFHDRNRMMGQLAFDLGNVYKHCKKPLANGSALFWTLFGGPDHANRFSAVKADEYALAQSGVEEIISRLAAARMSCDNAALIADEFQFAADLLAHACKRGQFLLDRRIFDPVDLFTELQQLTARHRQMWLVRNREGGLWESAARLNNSQTAYQ
jgi:hexosaminidase